MKKLFKFVFVLGMFILLSQYSFADKMRREFDSYHKLSGDRISCDQKSGFQEKFDRIQNIAEKKIVLLNKVELSLKEIISLVSSGTIKLYLEQQLKSVSVMKKKYQTFLDRINSKPEVLCREKSLLKSYNEETKLLIDKIKIQFKILKNK